MIPNTFKALRYGQGHTLVELLVAMGLAMFMVMGLVQGVLSSKSTYSAVNAQAELQQNGRAAMYFIEREIMRAGYQDKVSTAARFDETLSRENWPLLAGLGLHAGAVVGGVNNISDGTAKAGTDSVYLRYQGSSDMAMLTCSNEEVEPGDTVVAHFFVNDENELICSVSGEGVDRPGDYTMVSGVEDMQVLYGVTADELPPRINQYLTAAALGDGTAFTAPWSDVVSVSFALLVSSEERLTGETIGDSPVYQLLDQTRAPESDGLLRQVFSLTIGLRNKL